jgi:hypothetical protein
MNRFQRLSGPGENSSPTYTGAGTPLLPHGGARRRSGQSACLNRSQVENLINGAVAAMAMDRPLNTFLTCHWGAYGLSDNQAGDASQSLFRQARDWLRDNGSAAVWIWVRENDTRSERKGAHLHALLHVPVGLRPKFARQIARWCTAAAGDKRYQAKACRFGPVGPRVGCEIALPDVYRANLRAVVCYLLKGAPESVADSLDRIWRGDTATMPNAGSGGYVTGKRAGVSRALARHITRQVKLAHPTHAGKMSPGGDIVSPRRSRQVCLRPSFQWQAFGPSTPDKI